MQQSSVVYQGRICPGLTERYAICVNQKQEVNMRKVWVLVVVAVSLIVMMSAGVVLASNAHDMKIRDRIEKQQQRIDQGVISGSLTRREADMLQDNLNWIRNEEARLKADGRLTERERKRLHKVLDQNNEMIYDKKHNRIKRLR